MAQPIYLDPELQGIERQRQLAQALMQRGMQAPQGQMVSGRFVAPSATQYLANAFDAYSGKSGVEQAEQKAGEVRQRQQKSAADNIAEALRVSSGSPEQVSYSAEDVGPSMSVKPATQGDSQAAIARLLRPNATAAEQNIANKLIEQQFKEAKWEKVEQYDPKTGNTITGMVNVNSPRPETTFRQVAVSKPALSQKEIIELRDKGINVGGGMTMSGGQGGGMPSGQGGGQVSGDDKYLPANLPTYEYNPRLSPQQNRELAGKFEADLQKSVKNAKSAFNAIKAVSEIMQTNAPSSGRMENIVTGTREFFGKGGETSKADAQLKVLEQILVQQVPRFEGPQSDKDVASYKAAAGDVGNPNMPIASRMGALQILIDLNKKYYPNGDWDSINLNPPNIKPNMLGGTNTYFGATVQPKQESGWRVK